MNSLTLWSVTHVKKITWEIKWIQKRDITKPNNTVGFRKKMAVVATGTKCVYVPYINFYILLWFISLAPKPTHSLTCFLADSAHHCSQWLLQIARPVALARPSRGPGRHPHTIVDSASAWFGRNPWGGRAVNAFPTSWKWSFFHAWLSWNRSACGVVMTHPSAQAPFTHHGRCRLRLVWSRSVGGTSSWCFSNHGVNWYTNNQTVTGWA